ncbi:alanine racemase [Nocardioides zeae]|uniref:Alanine racemase n=1 Tax=Nocardioides imazamoxiresistens TaxID=3231893 RepID=A0ABU3PR86_9ACTN|nr:alanine racemase [Nocardioides zeae]MDT9591740.1 alanine racemase [Nocardioides zeae]
MSAPSRPEVVVDLAAVRRNVRTLRARVAPSAMMTVVKADGYGHGMVEVARAARAAGADWLGVATPAEALALRAAGDTGRVLCWLTMPGEDLAALVAAGVDVTAYSPADVDLVVAAAQAADVPARLQLKIDTGLHRGGALAEDWPALVRAALVGEAAGALRVTGIWSHLAASEDSAHPANDAQEAAFVEALAHAEEAGLRPEVRHLANSAAALLRPSAHFDLVRCGIATYGIDPAPDVAEGDVPGGRPDLVPAMTVRAPLVLTKRLQPGDGVSYGHTWVADRPTTVGLVPLGYGDGVPRHAAAGVGSPDAAEVWVDGRRRPVRGRVCMDQLVVDLDGDEPEAGAEVELFGTGERGAPTALDWARACGTIDYEIVTRLRGRALRRHVGVEPGPDEPGPDEPAGDERTGTHDGGHA